MSTFNPIFKGSINAAFATIWHGGARLRCAGITPAFGVTQSGVTDCASPREPNWALEKAIPPPRTDDVAPVKSIVPLFRPEASISEAASLAQYKAPNTPTRHARLKSAGSSSSRLPPCGPPPPLA